MDAFDPSHAEALRHIFRAAVNAREAAQRTVSATFFHAQPAEQHRASNEAFDQAKADEKSASHAYLTYLDTASRRALQPWTRNLSD